MTLVRQGGRLAGKGTFRLAQIASLATYVPPRVLTNADLEEMVETSDEWILKRTGIRKRHIVESGTCDVRLGQRGGFVGNRPGWS